LDKHDNKKLKHRNIFPVCYKSYLWTIRCYVTRFW